MPENNELRRRMRLCHPNGGIAEPPSAIAGSVRPACVRAAGGERSGEIRVQPSKRANGEAVAQHVTKRAIAPVFARPEPVPMFDASMPAGDVARPWAEPIVHADVVSENLATPTIVIASDHEDGNAGLGQISERRERAKAAPRDHRAPLEPELEQVTVDDDGSAGVREVSEKRDDRSLDACRRESEMCVGEDVARRVRHARMLPGPHSLY